MQLKDLEILEDLGLKSTDYSSKIQGAGRPYANADAAGAALAGASASAGVVNHKPYYKLTSAVAAATAAAVTINGHAYVSVSVSISY